MKPYFNERPLCTAAIKGLSDLSRYQNYSLSISERDDQAIQDAHK